MSEKLSMRMVVVSPEKDYPEEHGLVQEMFRQGLRTYHVRKPKYTTERLKSYLSKFDPKYLDRLVIHTHHELATQFKIKGIHLTERHRKKNKFRSWIIMKYIKYRRPEIQITTAFHVIHSITRMTARYNYVFLNPIFESISKVGYKSTFNDDSLIRGLTKTKYNVLAMGGVTHDNIEKVKEFGFKGFGLLGTLWQSADPVKEFLKVIDKCKELEIELY